MRFGLNAGLLGLLTELLNTINLCFSCIRQTNCSATSYTFTIHRVINAIFLLPIHSRFFPSSRNEFIYSAPTETIPVRIELIEELSLPNTKCN
jgi:hypothetical protein